MKQTLYTFEKLKIASFDFTCCEGCQLQLTNRESSLPDFLELLDIRTFREISDEHHQDYDIALIEGSISRSDEVERLRAIRKQAKVVIAFGTCACFGGINSLKNRFPPEVCSNEVYSGMAVETLPVRCRIDTPIEVEYYHHGGILPFVLRQLLEG